MASPSPANRASVLTKAVQSCQINLAPTSPFATQQQRYNSKQSAVAAGMKTPDPIKTESPSRTRTPPSRTQSSSLFRKSTKGIKQAEQPADLPTFKNCGKPPICSSSKFESSKIEESVRKSANGIGKEALKVRNSMSFANGTFGEQQSSSNVIDTSQSNSGILSGHTSRRSRHQIMGQINDRKTNDTLAAINEMLLITQNYLL